MSTHPNSSTHTLAVATLTALAAIGAAPDLAHAAALTLQVSGTSQVVEVVNPQGPVLRFATQTEGSGSFALTGYTSSDVVNMATGQGSGNNRFLAANGDELLGAFTVQVIPTDTPGSVLLQGLTQFLGGTGIFAGATGSASFQGNARFTSDTQAVVQFLHQGDVSLLPEPGSLALVAAGLAAAGATGTRARRKP